MENARDAGSVMVNRFDCIAVLLSRVQLAGVAALDSGIWNIEMFSDNRHLIVRTVVVRFGSG